jgi:hypothetical protein
MDLTKFGKVFVCSLAVCAMLTGCARQDSGTAQVATVAITPAPATAPVTASTPAAAIGSTDGLPVVVVTASRAVSRAASRPIVLTERAASSAKY